MGCCGKTTGRNEGGSTHATAGMATAGVPASTRTVVVPTSAVFEHDRASGLTVVGPATGRRYRFEGPGSLVEVDVRDAPALAAVPGLRRARPRVSRPGEV